MKSFCPEIGRADMAYVSTDPVSDIVCSDILRMSCGKNRQGAMEACFLCLLCSYPVKTLRESGEWDLHNGPGQ